MTHFFRDVALILGVGCIAAAASLIITGLLINHLEHRKSVDLRKKFARRPRND